MAIGPGGATKVSLGSLATGAVVVGASVVVGAAVVVEAAVVTGPEVVVSELDDPQPARPTSPTATTSATAIATGRSDLVASLPIRDDIVVCFLPCVL
jgi:hypothetical protein